MLKVPSFETEKKTPPRVWPGRREAYGPLKACPYGSGAKCSERMGHQELGKLPRGGMSHYEAARIAACKAMLSFTHWVSLRM